MAENSEVLRLLVGDTDPTAYRLQDNEVLLLLELCNDNAFAAAVLACNTLSAIYAGDEDSASVGDVSVSSGGRSERYAALALRLRRTYAGRMGLQVFMGGISESDKTLYELDTDNVRPAFTRALFEVRRYGASIVDERA